MTNIEVMKQALDALELATTPLNKDRHVVLMAIEALHTAIERPANVPTQKQSFPDRCNSQADQLDQLADDFEQLGWEGHRLRIVDLAGHLRIYAHQVTARLDKEYDQCKTQASAG